MNATSAFVLEIGCEEIPARFLDGAEGRLGESLSGALREARLLPDGAASVRTAATPRRLMAYMPALSSRQPDRVEQITGPPVKAAFDAVGKPTRAAESFAAKNGAKVSELKRVTTAKGEYVALDVSEPGRLTSEVLVEILPGVIGGISFPKSMYWTAKSGPLFARPIRWILALLGNDGDVQVVPFEFAGVKSGNTTYGLRLEGSQPIRVSDLNLDLLLQEHLVVVRGDDRRERVRRQLNVLLEDHRLRVARDKSLEDWVVNSTEWPVALMGGFDRRYLALPREVLVTVMRDHQKYFAVEDETGNLQARFVTVLNVPGDPKGLIREGHERVLEARFADAEFFWRADQKITLAARVPLLERVIWQAKLGTYADKVQRMKAIAENICVSLEEAGRLTPAEHAHALRAADLCKCDLTTQMVQEFTELQGIMGGLYAKSQGEPEEVADAIYDHYRPAGIEDPSPSSIVGAVLSLADKLDTVVSGFSAGLAPTGSSDPFGLRRAGNGVVKILVEQAVQIDLVNLTIFALAAIGQLPPHRSHLLDPVCKFLVERLAYYLGEGRRLRYDTVRAVLGGRQWGAATALMIPSNAAMWAKALESIRDTEDFAAIVAAAKRTRSILQKSASRADLDGARAIDKALLEQGAEASLFEEYTKAWNDLNGRQRTRIDDYRNALLEIAKLRPFVDAFFDNVLVMAQDENLRRNRLALLRKLQESVFSNFADLSEIVAAAGPGSGNSPVIEGTAV